MSSLGTIKHLDGCKSTPVGDVTIYACVAGCPAMDDFVHYLLAGEVGIPEEDAASSARCPACASGYPRLMMGQVRRRAAPR